MYDVIIIGGGLAGLFNALLLNEAGLHVAVIEKKSYPFHRVCGEYISNEVLPFFKEMDIDVTALHASQITRLEVTATSGAKFTQQLDLGGFGLSRYKFDHYLYQKCKAKGITFMLDTRVENIHFVQNNFEVILPDRVLTTALVIGSFGKRSNLDSKLNRSFFHHRSPYLGIKIHAKIDFPDDLIQLNSFKNGYCGITKIEDDRYCICSLAHRDDLRKCGSLQNLQKEVINKNPYQKALLKNAEMLMEKPEVINEISFEKKQPVEQHVLMSGDTAGMIAPLCGNGMTMAIHSAKILSALIIRYYSSGQAFSLAQRNKLEEAYTQGWNQQFAQRLWIGRQMQFMFGNNVLMKMAIYMLNGSPGVANYLMKQTHGKPFGLVK